MRVLVVDDEAPIMRLCVRALEDRGHSADGFTSGEALLAALAAAPADVLVVDYRMPAISGLEVIRRARRLRAEVKVVLITGHGTDEVATEAKAVGVDALLVKPFTPDELGMTLAALGPGGGRSSPTVRRR